MGVSFDRYISAQRTSRPLPSRRTRLILSICPLFTLLFSTLLTAQTPPADPPAPLTEAPLPEPSPSVGTMNAGKVPCRIVPYGWSEGVALVSAAAAISRSLAGIAPFPPDDQATSSPPLPSPAAATKLPPCPSSVVNPLNRFVNGPVAPLLTRRQKAILAARNVIDPFNAITILATAAISVGADSHSPYGPGMEGFAKNVGVAYSQDITGQFFNVFLIPSLLHQDPRYYRMPHANIPRRVLNSIVQVCWSRSDSGRGIPNYATFLGFAINAEISNLYVPGIETDRSATAQRYVTGLAFAPIDNLVTEFLPDVASKIHVRIVIVQRVINQVARTEPAGAP